MKRYQSRSCVRLFLTLVTYLITSFTAKSQIFNYDLNGARTESSSEEVSILVSKKADHPTRGANSSISLPGVIGSVVTLGTDVVKIVLSNQEAKYTATYKGVQSESELVYLKNKEKLSSVDLNIDSVTIIRTTISKSLQKTKACEINLIPIVQSNNGLFRFKLDRLNIPFSKAKVKKTGSNGSMIDISVTIKVEAYWKEPVDQAKGDTKQDSSYQIKTATLGESTIFISSVQPGNFPIVKDYYSGWYQFIPVVSLKYASSENNYRVGNYSLTITVKEANPYALDSKKIADFFNATNPDINGLIKQFLPTTAK